MRGMFGVVGLVFVLAACAASERPTVQADEDGAYTVSAEQHFEVVWSNTKVEFQALEAGELETSNLRNPLLTIQIRNYNPISTGPRSRAVPQIRWYSDTTPIKGTMTSWLEPADGWETIAANGQKQVDFTVLAGRASRTLSWPSPYVYQPDARMCAWISAQLEATAPNGDQVWGVLETRVCEASAQRQPQDTIVSTQSSTDADRVTRTVQLRHMPGRGHRALVRVQPINPYVLDERLCLHSQGFATCRRSSGIKETFSRSGVGEYVTGYIDGLSGDICASVRGVVGACSSGEMELLKAHNHTDGINTNVTIIENDAGVFARYRISLPQNTSIQGGLLTFRDAGGTLAGFRNDAPVGEGEQVLEREQGPLSAGLSYCYGLELEGQGQTRPVSIFMEGCTP